MSSSSGPCVREGFRLWGGFERLTSAPRVAPTLLVLGFWGRFWVFGVEGGGV